MGNTKTCRICRSECSSVQKSRLSYFAWLITILHMCAYTCNHCPNEFIENDTFCSSFQPRPSQDEARDLSWAAIARHAWVTWKHAKQMTASPCQHCRRLPRTGLSWCCPRALRCSRRSPASGWRAALWIQTCTGCTSHSGASPESLPPPGYRLCW